MLLKDYNILKIYLQNDASFNLQMIDNMTKRVNWTCESKHQIRINSGFLKITTLNKEVVDNFDNI
jgi:hypothetical protein